MNFACRAADITWENMSRSTKLEGAGSAVPGHSRCFFQTPVVGFSCDLDFLAIIIMMIIIIRMPPAIPSCFWYHLVTHMLRLTVLSHIFSHVAIYFPLISSCAQPGYL